MPQGRIVGSRVRGTVPLLWDVVATLGVGFERHDNPPQTVTGIFHAILSQTIAAWSMQYTHAALVSLSPAELAAVLGDATALTALMALRGR